MCRSRRRWCRRWRRRSRGGRKKEKKRGASRTIETALRITSLLALPAAAGLSVLAGPILNLLFAARPDEALAATLPLNILAIAVFFNSVVLLSNAILQSLGRCACRCTQCLWALW